MQLANALYVATHKLLSAVAAIVAAASDAINPPIPTPYHAYVEYRGKSMGFTANYTASTSPAAYPALLASRHVQVIGAGGTVLKDVAVAFDAVATVAFSVAPGDKLSVVVVDAGINGDVEKSAPVNVIVPIPPPAVATVTLVSMTEDPAPKAPESQGK
jgi:hypothetical protein